MTCRVHSEQVTIDHVGNPGQRMPIARIIVSEGPDDVVPAQAGGHHLVIDHVFRIIEVDEVEPDGAGEYNECNQPECGGYFPMNFPASLLLLAELHWQELSGEEYPVQSSQIQNR